MLVAQLQLTISGNLLKWMGISLRLGNVSKRLNLLLKLSVSEKESKMQKSHFRGSLRHRRLTLHADFCKGFCPTSCNFNSTPTIRRKYKLICKKKSSVLATGFSLLLHSRWNCWDRTCDISIVRTLDFQQWNTPCGTRLCTVTV